MSLSRVEDVLGGKRERDGHADTFGREYLALMAKGDKIKVDIKLRIKKWINSKTCRRFTKMVMVVSTWVITSFRNGGRKKQRTIYV